MGLPGSKRLSNEFHVESAPAQGTKVTLVRWKTV
jgi:serine/threonine-protein kinase RsbT